MKHTEKKPTRIRTAEELKIFCEGKLILPQRTLRQKNGKGIYKRYIHYVSRLLKISKQRLPASGTAGPGPVNRRIRKGKTVKGSSKFHVFADVGKSGKLVCRERGCHQPECHCWAGQYNRCKQVPRDSLGLVQAGHPLLPQSRQIAPDSQAEHMIPLTRNALCRRGIALAGGSEGQLELGDVIAVYVDDASEQIMLGQITRL